MLHKHKFICANSPSDLIFRDGPGRGRRRF